MSLRIQTKHRAASKVHLLAKESSQKLCLVRMQSSIKLQNQLNLLRINQKAYLICQKRDLEASLIQHLLSQMLKRSQKKRVKFQCQSLKALVRSLFLVQVPRLLVKRQQSYQLQASKQIRARVEAAYSIRSRKQALYSDHQQMDQLKVACSKHQPRRKKTG